MSNKRKYSGNSAENPQPKKRKIEPALEYFSNVPKEIFIHILSYVASTGDSIAAQMLSMTCKKFNEYLSVNENRLWHSIYLRAKFHINKETVNKTAVVLDEDGFPGTEMNKDEADLVLDSLSAQQALYNSPTTYIECELEYERLKGASPEWFLPKPLELSKEEYDASVSYRELAIDCWWKRLQFELFLRLNGSHQKALEEKAMGQNDEDNDDESQDESNDESDDDESDDDERNDENSSNDSWGRRRERYTPPESEDEDESKKRYNVQPTNESEKEELSDDDSAYTSEDDVDDTNNDIEPQYLEREAALSFLSKTSNSEKFGLLLQILSAAATGHMPALDFDAAEPNHSLCPCLLSNGQNGSVPENFFQQVKEALSMINSISGMQSIVCALHSIGITDVLYLHELVCQQFPYLASVYSAYNIEQHFFRREEYDKFDESIWFFFQFNADLDEDRTKLPDWLAMNQSMFKLMRKAGVKEASPNATDYAIETLRNYVKTVLSNIMENKKDVADVDLIDENASLDVDETDVQKALISMTMDRKSDDIQMQYREHEWLHENELMMFSDSECNTYESSYEDESEEDEDLSEYKEILYKEPEKENNKKVWKRTESDDEMSVDEEYCDKYNNFIVHDDDEYTPLNDLLKKNITGLTKVDDKSQLFINTAIRHAQKDQINDKDNILLPDGAITVAEENERALNERIELLEPQYDREEPGFGESIQSIEADKLPTAWVNKSLLQEAYYYHGNVELDQQTIDEFKIKYIEDIPINELTPEKQAQVFEIRRETNRLLKEQFLNERKEFEIARWRRLTENYQKYCKDISEDDKKQCKSLEINLTVDNELVKSIVDRAIKIIPQCSNLKTVKVRIEYDIEEDELGNYFHDESCRLALYKLFDHLSNCQTLESLIVIGEVPYDDMIVKLLETKKLKRFEYRTGQSMNATTAEMKEAIMKHQSVH